ncbi:hypothetical protein CesoFtcFv8_009594 [Champsocephalus esox]|uniref:Uncharacterized protein n=1 Tax=Champsocephalus esox TaxID=159716 RepID=A0AAN8CDT2_9TELE|nr:hypothetical protein CesoFtcFv8_009594 [Champsocephalus esox]
MRRFAAGVTTESHELYPAFMRQLSLCIFEVDSGDARRLIEAKQSQLEGKHGMVGLTDGEVIRRITREEWRLHCRRRTRGAEETALLIQDLLQTFGGTTGRDTLDIPLLDPLRIQDIWSTQRPHLGSTSLESFHLHLNRFIPGTYLKHVLNQKSQRVLGRQLVKDFTKPAEYTGELIGVEFLYRQTGKVLEDVSLDPDIPDEAAAIQSLEEVDEGIEEDVEDPTVFQPDIPSTSAAARSGDPADEPRSEPSGPAAPHQPDPPEAPEAPAQQSSSDSEEEMQGPDGQPGYQHVLKLAKALLEARSLQGFSDKRVDDLMALWQRLPEPDRRRVVYPPRHRERQPKGRFKAAKGKNTSCPGKESLQRCLLGLHSGPATWPSTSRLVEAICSQLCRLHHAATRSGGIMRTRWFFILTDYVAIREAVLASPRLMAQTEIQLFELNQRTLSQWFTRRQKEGGVSVLQQGTGVVPAVAMAVQPLPLAKGLSFIQCWLRGELFLICATAGDRTAEQGPLSSSCTPAFTENNGQYPSPRAKHLVRM